MSKIRSLTVLGVLAALILGTAAPAFAGGWRREGRFEGRRFEGRRFEGREWNRGGWGRERRAYPLRNYIPIPAPRYRY